MKRSLDSVAWTAVAVGLLVSGAFVGRLPVYPVAVALLLPLTAICVHGIIRIVARRTLPQHLREPANAIATRLVLFIIALHVLLISNLAGVAWARAFGPRGVVILLGALLISAGNLLPRLRPNLAIGIRTHRMLSDARLWARMHRFAGYTTVIAGCAVGVAGLFLSEPTIGSVVSICAIGCVASLSLAYWNLTHD
jgi:SdpI/YhfL family protein